MCRGSSALRLTDSRRSLSRSSRLGRALPLSGSNRGGRPTGQIAGVNRLGALQGGGLRQTARLPAQEVKHPLLPGNHHHSDHADHEKAGQNGLEVTPLGENHLGLINILRRNGFRSSLKRPKGLADFFSRKANIGRV